MRKGRTIQPSRASWSSSTRGLTCTVCSGLQVSPPVWLPNRSDIELAATSAPGCQGIVVLPRQAQALAVTCSAHASLVTTCASDKFSYPAQSIEPFACCTQGRPRPTVLRHAMLQQHVCGVDAGVEALELHPLQASSVDQATRGSEADPARRTLTVPARTAAVFVTPR
jgi:hypothetical protein